MLILFDQGTPVPLRQFLQGYEVTTAYKLGWSRFKYGELLAAAEAWGFEVLLTTDTSLRYQQNLATRSIAVIVLGTTSWPRIKLASGIIRTAIDGARPGMYAEVSIP